MRLFVALVPPSSVRDHLAAAVGEVKGAWPQLGWVAPERWHLTLAFLGAVGQERLPGLHERLERVARRHPCLALCFAGAGTFPRQRARARVLWTGVYGDRRELGHLAAGTVAAAAGAKVPVDDRPYRPHLTLARVRTPVDVGPLVDALAEYTGPQWRAARLELVESFLGPHPRYETRASWALSDS